MFQIDTEVHIQASPEQVWQGLVDFPAYPEWNPYIAVRGEAGHGKEIEWLFIRPALKHRFWVMATIWEFETARTLGWRLGIRGVFTLHERYELEPAAGFTRLRHRITCSGVMALLAGRLLRRRFSNAVEAANEGLRCHVELWLPKARVDRRPRGRRRGGARRSRAGRLLR